MNDAIFTILGLAAGALVVMVVVTFRRRQEAAITARLIDETRKSADATLATAIDQLKTSFAALSRDALSTNTDDFLKLARTSLEKQTADGEKSLQTKKQLIDARLEEMGTKLTALNTLIHSVERQRAQAHGALHTQIEKSTQASNRLHETTAQLREALANPQRRGQWGERMAEDVLRLAGFIEGINYTKQQQTAEGTRPDFTFPLADQRRLHMDVKFPLANYMKMLDTDDEATRDGYASQFIKDVRARIKEVTTRDYVDPAHGTVDFVLVFIPNEQIYGFIHEHDAALLDDALRRKVALCSPMTLYAILAIVRQTTDNLRIEQNSKQILNLLAEFKKQWGKYVDGMDVMGKRLEAATKEYHELVGVRTRKLERELDKIDDLRTDPVAPIQAPPPQPLLEDKGAVG